MGKKELNLSISRDTTGYMKNLKDTARKFQQVTSEFSKLTRYRNKMSAQNQVYLGTEEINTWTLKLEIQFHCSKENEIHTFISNKICKVPTS